MKTKNKIAEDLYEIINDLRGFRDIAHSQWVKEDRAHLKRITMDKNISLYFANGKGIDKNNLYLEFRDIRGIKAFIKSLKKMG